MVQYFSLTTNQPIILSAMAYQPSEHIITTCLAQKILPTIKEVPRKIVVAAFSGP
jgi:hypothetical protein